MPRQIIRCILILAKLALVSATIALAQSPESTETFTIPVGNSYINNWQVAHQVGSSEGMLFLVTQDQPHHKKTCRIKSFTKDKIVCSRAFGATRTYAPQQVLALILPGDDGAKLRIALGLNAALGTAIWGTVVFAATCPGCAVATGIAALVCFIAAAGILAADDQPDRVLYLASGQHLTGKLGSIEPIVHW